MLRHLHYPRKDRDKIKKAVFLKYIHRLYSDILFQSLIDANAFILD